mmetsp:Transcript_65761/g.169979  ORF Transcript_65761/g.169979 Transcript_65761/m.169979 type:complete len:308 (-) Transcript_65761:21-944(-)
MDRLFLHMTLITEIFQKLQEQRLMSGLGMLEQDIACGVDKSGKDVKDTNLQGGLRMALTEMETVLSSETRLRLLMLYFACMANISEVVRTRLIEMAKLEPEDQEVLMAMLRTKLMEVPESQRHRHGSGCVHRVTKEQAARFKRNATAGGLELSRFEPRLKELIEQLTQDRLNNEDFATLGGSDVIDNSLRGTGAMGCAPPGAPTLPDADTWSFSGWKPGSHEKAGWLEAGSHESTSSATQRVVVFVIGGITHSELRVASEVMQALPRGTEILVGGTALLTPRRLIRALKPQGVRLDSLAHSDPADLT